MTNAFSNLNSWGSWEEADGKTDWPKIQTIMEYSHACPT